MIPRWRARARSLFALPRWVRICVAGVRMPATAMPFVLLRTPSGRAPAHAPVSVVATNVSIMLQQRGMSRLMSLPHRVAGIPLDLFLMGQLAQGAVITGAKWALAAGRLATNAISLAFDLVDTLRWLAGNRSVARSLTSGRPTSC